MELTQKQIDEKLRATKDLLSLVGVKATLVALRSLSGWEREQAADWAVRVYLLASDNAVNVPPKPRCLRSFPEIAR
jgi:hypothetical protein